MCKRKLKVDKNFRNKIKKIIPKLWFNQLFLNFVSKMSQVTRQLCLNFCWCSIWEMPRTCVNQWNHSEKQMKCLGLAEGDYKETFLFRRGDSLPLVHTTEQVRFFFWGVRWHPPDIFCEGVFCQKVITHPVICDLQNLACNTRHQRNAGSTLGWGRLTRGWTTLQPAGPPIDVVG